jgi:capsular polysaccharide transport system ATP-binding protein
MIILEGMTKFVSLNGDARVMFDNVNMKIPTNRRIALLGQSDDQKKLLVDLLSGMVMPTAGRIVRLVHVSFPVGYAGGYSPDLSVRLNIAHIARLYGVDVKTVVSFVERFGGLGDDFDKPYEELSRETKRRLAQVVVYSVPFDFYLLQHDVMRGRKVHRDVPYDLFAARSRIAGMLIPTQSLSFAREFCDMAILIDGAQLYSYEDVQEGIAVFEQTCLAAMTQ